MVERRRRPGLNGTADAAEGARDVLVTVVLMGELKRLAGRREIVFRLRPGFTVHDVARRLRSECEPAFATRVLTPNGDLQPHVAVFVDGAQLPGGRDGPGVLSGGRLEFMLVPMHEGG